jgi:hypothetical protein
VEDISPAKLRYMIRSGRLALLFDGFDELELRIGYDNAADYLQTLLAAVTERAKVVLTSRTQHFRSTAQVRTALGDRVTAMAASRAAVVADFAPDQILEFLTNRFGGDRAAAHARYALLADVEDLLGLSRNPRMLSFIADLDEDRLRAIQRERGRISAAELYRELADFWLVGEADRQRHRGSVASLDERERLAACEALALKLWTSMSPTIPAADLSAAVSTTLTRLAERGYTAAQAAHTVGSGTLLVRADDGAFTFVHQSIMEWLVANVAAERCRAGGRVDVLTGRRLSRLTADFFCDLAGHDTAHRWARETLADPTASEVGKQNALAVSVRAGAAARDLAGVDLRDQDLAGQDLRGADLRGANWRGMRLDEVDLAGADLSRADLTGVRMTGGSLRSAVLTGSQWRGAALLGVQGVDDPPDRPELVAAAIAGRDRAVAVLGAGGGAFCVAFSADQKLLAIGRAGLSSLSTPPTGAPCGSSPATPAGCGAWRFLRTARSWPPPPTMPPRGCGTPPPVPPASPWQATPARWWAWRSPPTARSWPAPPTMPPRGCGTPPPALPAAPCKATPAGCGAWRSLPMARRWPPPPTMAPRGCGMPPPALPAAPCKATPAGCGAWRSPPTARSWPPPPTMAPRGCGTPPPAPPASP